MRISNLQVYEYKDRNLPQLEYLYPYRMIGSGRSANRDASLQYRNLTILYL